MKATKLLIALAVLGSGACDFNLTDPNNPGPIGNDPSPSEVQASVVGIILSARSDAADWNLDAGILGRLCDVGRASVEPHEACGGSLLPGRDF